MKTYDCIITGAGCSGLLLAHALSRSNWSVDKQILIIDRNISTHQDKTIAFWENTPNIYDWLLLGQWQKLRIANTHIEVSSQLQSYRYKMLRWKSLREYILGELALKPNYKIIEEEITQIAETTSYTVVFTRNNLYHGQHVFNSIPDNNNETHYSGLKQYFKGWEISTANHDFDSQLATLMDFRIDLKNQGIFCYLLPLSSNRAFVEVVHISTKALENGSYASLLSTYIEKNLGIVNYNIIYSEAGTLAMSTNTKPFRTGKHLFNIGCRGGMLKSSTGYAFSNMQRQAEQITKAFEKRGKPSISKSLFYFRHKLYDDTLLDVLINKRQQPGNLFLNFFQKNQIERILRFLDNNSHLSEEIKIFLQVKKLVFIKAITHVIWQRTRNFVQKISPIKKI
jgi:lycopene beta-cyclase